MWKKQPKTSQISTFLHLLAPIKLFPIGNKSVTNYIENIEAPAFSQHKSINNAFRTNQQQSSSSYCYLFARLSGKYHLQIVSIMLESQQATSQLRSTFTATRTGRLFRWYNPHDSHRSKMNDWYLRIIFYTFLLALPINSPNYIQCAGNISYEFRFNSQQIILLPKLRLNAIAIAVFVSLRRFACHCKNVSIVPKWYLMRKFKRKIYK